MSLTRRRRIATAVLGAALGIGCGSGSGPAPAAVRDSGPPCPTDTIGIQNDILMPRCGKLGCHVGEDPAQGLDLVSPGLEARIDGVVGACERPIVTPGDPNGSYLITKVSRRSPSCGEGMPYDGTVLSSRDVSCLVSWVKNLPPASPMPDASAFDAGRGGEGGAPGDGGGGGGGAGGSTPVSCPDGKMRCGTTCITAVDPTFDAIYAGIMKRSCVFDSCHGGTAPKEHLGFVTVDDAYQNLVSVPSAQRPELLRVDPGHPDSSYMIDKLRNRDLGLVTTTGKPSGPMPLPPSKPLCEGKIAVIEKWIESGAAR